MSYRNLSTNCNRFDVMATLCGMLNSRCDGRWQLSYPIGEANHYALSEMELVALSLAVGDILYGPNKVLAHREGTSAWYAKDNNKVLEYEYHGSLLVDSNSVYDFQNSTGKGYPMNIQKVIYNDPATIVIWEDGSKTVVKCGPGDVYDPEKGLAMAIVKRAYGDKGSYYEIFKKFAPTKEEILDGIFGWNGCSKEALDLMEILRAMDKLSGNAKPDDEKKEKK